MQDRSCQENWLRLLKGLSQAKIIKKISDLILAS